MALQSSYRTQFYTAASVVGFLVLVLVGANVFLYLRVKAKSGQFVSALTQNAEVQKKQELAPILMEKKAIVDEERAKLEAIFFSPGAENELRFAQTLQEIASSTAVSLGQEGVIQAKPAQTAREGDSTHTFTASVRGSYGAIMNFLAVLEYMRPIVAVEGITLGTQSDGAIVSQSAGELQARLVLGLSIKPK
ncbi:MAG: hypothetical protein HY460_00745 [Parcubacteria group bacterium]|nr:hypothetical protein [Parcubacteria group bacterium]